MAEVMTKVERKKNIVNVKGVIVTQISSPSTIQRVAVDKAVNPQEVYVRVTFKYEGNEYTVSNKLKFLTKAGYEELIKAKDNQTPMDFAVDTESGFFYVEKNVSVDELFKTPVKSTNTRTNLAALIV